MFSDKLGLTKSVLEGKKTMTRRLVSEKLLEEYANYDDYCNSMGLDGIGMPVTRKFEKEFFLERSPYKVGEVIAIAQSYETVYYENIFKTQCPNSIDGLGSPGWTNKMFVSADLMPYAIKITDVKVERLQDISEEDCLKEGVVKCSPCVTGCYLFCDIPSKANRGNATFNPIDSFSLLIDKVSGKGTWDSNPYVYAYSFEVINNQIC